MRYIALILAAIFVLPHSAFAAESETSLVGKKIAEFALSDFRGKQWQLSDFDEHPVLVVAFMGVECPLVKLYSKRLVALEEEFSDQGAAFVGINANQQDSLTEMAHLARTHEMDFPLLKDPGNRVADQFQATRTPEFFILDRDRVVRYHGRIDDQFTYEIQRPEIEHDYLRDWSDELDAFPPPAVKALETVARSLESK